MARKAEDNTAWAVQKKANYFKLNRKFVELPSFIYGNLVLRAVILKAMYLVFIRTSISIIESTVKTELGGVLFKSNEAELLRNLVNFIY